MPLTTLIIAYNLFQLCLAGGTLPAPLVVAAYDSSIHCVPDFITHLKFVPQFSRKDKGRAGFLADLMQQILNRYLSGSGHAVPSSEEEGSLLDAETVERARGNTTLRAELLLKATTDSTALPVDPDWDIKVNTLASIHLRRYLPCYRRLKYSTAEYGPNAPLQM